MNRILPPFLAPWVRPPYISVLLCSLGGRLQSVALRSGALFCLVLGGSWAPGPLTPHKAKLALLR